MYNSNNSSQSNSSKNNLNENINLTDVKLEETFKIIESIINLKLCQYHQILPINVKNRTLTLAMVNAEDKSILEHIKTIIKPYNYTLNIQNIDQQTHQIIISSYLKSHQPILSQKKFLYEDKTHIEIPNQTKNKPSEIKNQQHHNLSKTSSDLSSKIQNKLKDLKDNINISGKNKHNLDNSKSPITDITNLPRSSSAILNIDAHYLSAPPEFLVTLSPPQIWRELLARILMSGIGRLYFEKKADYGRILWSQNGVLQFSINKISTITFCDILNEIKKMVHLPLIQINKLTKVEIEKYYNNERLLFRLRLNIGEYGEEGNLQVLRGKALIFYQQRQMNDMANQALEIAQKLERKLRLIRARKQINPSPIYNLNELYELQASIQQQLKLLEES